MKIEVFFLNEGGEAALLRLLDFLERGVTTPGGVVFSIQCRKGLVPKEWCVGGGFEEARG